MSRIDAASQSLGTERDLILDGLRAIAIVRVMTWHTTGWEWTTWFVSSVPAMFAITGALLASSFRKHGLRTTLGRRFSRFFLPFWVYCGLVYFLSLRFNVPTSALWTFMVPFDEPMSAIASEWFTSALWYVRAYLWVLLLSPLLYLLVQRLGIFIPLLGGLVVVYLGWSGRDESTLGWAIGDIVLYATCAAGGMALLGTTTVSRLKLFSISAGFLLGVLLWTMTQSTTSKVVNNDHVLHLLLGGFWLSLLLTMPATLSKCAKTRVSRYLNSYPLSIYLWHSMIAWFFWQSITDTLSPFIRSAAVALATFVSLPLMTYVVGYFEKKPWTIPPLRLAGTRVAVVSVLLAGLSIAPVDAKNNLVKNNLNQPLPPSAAPTITKIQIDDEISRYVDSSTFTSAAWATKKKKLQTVLERYDTTMKLGGTRAIVISPDGDIWQGATAKARPFSEPSLIGSLTKTFTTTLIMRLVERQVLDLDEPVGDLGINFAHSEVTIRQLLSQTSGMPKFSNQSGRVSNGTTVREVLDSIGSKPARFKPGTDIEYSTTGFVVLGALLEQKTGLTYDQLLQREIASPLGYDITTFIGKYGSVGFATGGISMKMADLANWSRRYFYHQNTSERKWPWLMKRTTGMGAHGYCPCENGNFMALGHIGGRTFASVDGDGTVVVIDTRGILVLNNYKTTQSFAHELRLVAGGGTKFLYRK